MSLNSNTLKLAYALAQFLYANKKLDLPGIGTFQLDPSVIIDSDSSRHKVSFPEGINFIHNAGINSNPALIEFISSKTGKMKPLATSDLESHLQLIHQFLNIGKPFLLDGIGTISKTKEGHIDFVAGAMITEKTKDPVDEVHNLTKKETVDAKYQAYLSTPSQKNWIRKPVIALLVLSGIALAIWGGYTISSKNDDEALVEEEQLASVPVNDAQLVPDSLNKQAHTAPSDEYKYVLEVAKSNRAFRRYNQLKTNSWKVQLETSDSVNYKLFMLLPATSDTTRTLDSLTVMTGRKVYIEPQN